MIRAALTALARLSTGRRYCDLRIGPGSQVDFWKLRAQTKNGLEVGARSLFSARVIYERPGARLRIGSRSFVGNGLMSIAECIEIGDDVMISWGSTIVDHHSHSLRASERLGDVERWLAGEKVWSGVKIAAVRIENRAWLGFNVSVLAGVTIGEGAIVGACSLVTNSIPPWTIAAGNPARPLRALTEEERK
jgi:acetyltransferase-like isoleucine patch superfamily enzyme